SKLSTMSLLLVILAICSYEDDLVCDAVTRECLSFILGSNEDLRRKLERFDAPPEAVKATLEVKRCVDQMMYGDRVEVSEALVCSFCFKFSEDHD
uniref:Uncharacterized protein n=1 Tax=Mus spicilegus TaxID=10103 RepID=A0A8C6HMS7_MUSSI